MFYALMCVKYTSIATLCYILLLRGWEKQKMCEMRSLI